MSTGQDELMTEAEAARHLGVTPERVREFAVKGELHGTPAQGPHGFEVLYNVREVLRLKERLRGQVGDPGSEEWPDVLGE